MNVLTILVILLAPLAAAERHPIAVCAAAVASLALCWGLSRALLGKVSWALLIVGTAAGVWLSSLGILWLRGYSLWGAS